LYQKIVSSAKCLPNATKRTRRQNHPQLVTPDLIRGPARLVSYRLNAPARPSFKRHREWSGAADAAGYAITGKSLGAIAEIPLPQCRIHTIPGNEFSTQRARNPLQSMKKNREILEFGWIFRPISGRGLLSF
jgi:hypothetical protein